MTAFFILGCLSIAALWNGSKNRKEKWKLAIFELGFSFHDHNVHGGVHRADLDFVILMAQELGLVLLP